MIKNFITIAWRKIKSQRFYAVTNIMGLAIGIACCLLITLLVLDEVSYDNYHERSEDIYRITGEYNFNGQYNKVAVATSLMAEVVKSEVPEIEQTARMRAYGSWLVRKEGSIENIREYSVIYADASIFDIFNFPLISGDKATILNQPNTMVISQSAARRYFGEADPIGETLVLDNDENFVIVGVCEDVPFNTHFQYEFFLSMVELDEMVNDIWLNNNFHTYIRLRPGSDVDEVYTKVNETFKKYAAPQIQQFIGASFDELEASGNYFRYNLQPVRSIHLNSNMTAEHQPNGEKAYVWIFSAIALFVLLIACINFMNLATARSANRAKEVGMRKVLGSSKKTLIVQFLMESVLMSGIAFLLGLSIARIAMPAFNALTGKSLAIPFFNPAFIGVSIFAVLLIGALAGSYPAFFLSAFDPLKVLKGNLKHGAKSGLLRQFLVTSQFTLSIVMMIGTGVIYKQLSYIQNKRLGFEKDQVLTLSASNYPGSFDALIDQIDNFPEVKSSTVTCYLPISNSCRSNNAHWLEGEDMLNETKSIQQWQVDYDFLNTYQMKMAEGRYFSRDFTTDSSAVVINQAAVELLGLENPIGERIQSYINPQEGIIGTRTIVGVVENFNYENLKDNIDPLIMYLNDDMVSTISMLLDANTDIQPFIDKLQMTWNAGAPGQPFDYDFVDEQFNQMYRTEQQLGQIFLIFAGLAIFIACLGLLALSAFTAERRTKEISIRKVLGASVTNLVSLLSSEFLKLVLIALIIAVPIAWYAMKSWLQNFAYRADLSWWLFAVAGLLAVLIALLTVSFQSIKAALSNPMDALRNE